MNLWSMGSKDNSYEISIVNDPLGQPKDQPRLINSFLFKRGNGRMDQIFEYGDQYRPNV